jgi:membrane associated rhomboid family serine protease
MASPPDDGQVPPPAPTCFRHPGRQTYVSCVRCGRPACPDCLRPAAVGHQCVECIKEGNQGVRQATGRFGGTVSATPRVTWTIMGLNIVLYLVLLAHTSLANDWAMLGGAVAPNGQLVGVAAGQWYRMITSAFLPGTGYLGILDIAFNLWALYIVGPAMERLLGPVRFVAIYLASALGGALSYYLLAAPNVPALGASGAIFGLFGALLIIGRHIGAPIGGIAVVIGINLVFTFLPGSGIAWQAHVGGLITGAVAGLIFARTRSRERRAMQVWLLIALFVALCGVVVASNLALAR